MTRLTEKKMARNRALALGGDSMVSGRMRIVRDDLGYVHVGDRVRYTGSGVQVKCPVGDSQRFYNEIGTVAELRGTGWLGAHFPHYAHGTNLAAYVGDFQLVECIHGNCPDGDADCDSQGCPEHPAHDGAEHTWEQHHSPADHIGPDYGEHPELCRCTIYL